MSNFVITGRRLPNGCIVDLNGHPLPLHITKCSHSPTGFEWGYGGSGPAQLSFCILYEYFRKVENYSLELAEELAHKFHQRFKWAVIAPITISSFSLSGNTISAKLKELQNDGAL